MLCRGFVVATKSVCAFRSTGLAWPHRTVQGLHKASVNVTVIRCVHCRWILLMRILRIRRRYVHHSDRELTGLVHEATELSRLVHVACGRLRHSVAIRGHEIRVQRHVGTDSARGALHLGTGTSRVKGLPIQALARVRLGQGRHVRVRRGPRGGSICWVLQVYQARPCCSNSSRSRGASEAEWATVWRFAAASWCAG